jgi:hypothetical protein
VNKAAKKFKKLFSSTFQTQFRHNNSFWENDKKNRRISFFSALIIHFQFPFIMFPLLKFVLLPVKKIKVQKCHEFRFICVLFVFINFVEDL